MNLRKIASLLLAFTLAATCPVTPALAADEPLYHTHEDVETVIYEVTEDTEIVEVGETQEESDNMPTDTPITEETCGDEPNISNVDGNDPYKIENDTVPAEIEASEPVEPEVPIISTEGKLPADEEELLDIPLEDELPITELGAPPLLLAAAASHPCGVGTCTCTGSCGWAYTNYSPISSTSHSMSVYCTGCGAYAITDVSGSHSFRGNTCSLCGYTKACSHPSSKRTYNGGCNWVDICTSCGAALRSGTTHGPYSYGSWSYYNATQHIRYYTCSYGDSGTYYETANHSTTTSYTQYSATQHAVSSYCSTCSSTVGSTTYANHTFTYGSWENYSATQHRRLKTCSACGYSEYDYTSHGFSYGTWENTSAAQHRRLKSCATCGKSEYEYASHSFAYGAWSPISAEQHRRTGTCTCGRQDTQQEAHVCLYGEWASVSDKQHERTGTCTCGWQDTQQEDHSFSYGEWTVISEEQHRRSGDCVCGHQSEQQTDHADADDDGYCDACSYLLTRFSVTVPANLSMTVSQHGVVHAATNAAIINNSTGAVKVASLTVSTENGWTLAPYSVDMADTKVDAKQIGFALNGAQTCQFGLSEGVELIGDWRIARGASFPLMYDAVVSATSTPINEQVLTLVFVLDWAA